MIYLSDDGTLDTVLACSDCREEFRFNYDPDIELDDTLTWTYDDFVLDCIAEIKDEHECPGRHE